MPIAKESSRKRMCEIRKLVKKEAKELEWKYHIKKVLKYSKELAKDKKLNNEILELAVLLHDIGRFRHGSKNHEKTGKKDAEKILKEYNYSKEIIQEVKHCIETHRITNKTKTKYAEILSNADVMSHFDFLAYFHTLSKTKDFYKIIRKFKKKLDYEWKYKLTIKKAKKLTKNKYKAIKLVLKDY